MKQFGLIIAIFLFIVVAVASVVVAYNVITQRQAETTYQQYVSKYAQQNPQNKNKAPTGTPTAVPSIAADSLDTELQAITDDGGKSDFDQLQSGINAL
ncbi:hypothetical protein HYV22_03925 [Candidatus Gottesmanbacteria bacterium]|nr:hypothetical protein [Candidatus Gottesmanbacteria bacterium]